MLIDTFFIDIELHKNNLRLDIAWFKMLLFETIFDNYNKDKMIFLQQQIILKEHYLKELNINNFERVSNPINYKTIQQPLQVRLHISII